MVMFLREANGYKWTVALRKAQHISTSYCFISVFNFNRSFLTKGIFGKFLIHTPSPCPGKDCQCSFCYNFKNCSQVSIRFGRFTHSSLSAVMHSPFMHQCWRLPHRLAQCMSPQGWRKLVNAALLSLINEACVNVGCTTLLSSELVGPTCVQAQSSNPRGRACRPNGKGLGRRG